MKGPFVALDLLHAPPEAFETQSDEDEELFRSGDLIVPSTLKSEFFEAKLGTW